MTDEIKDKVQQEALQAIEDNNGRGIVVIATGGGKSRVPILYALKHKIPGEEIALIVPSTELRDSDWEKHFIECGALDLYKNIERYCYASLPKIFNKKFSLVILDECHHITPLNFEFFQNNSFKSIIALTATLPKENIKKNLLKNLGLNPIYRISLDEAQEINLVAPYSIEIHYTTLDDTIKNVEAGNKNKRFLTTERKMYNYLTQKIAEIKGDNDLEDKILSISEKKMVEMLTLKRMRIIYNSKNKTELAKRILRNISKEERVLIFSGSINQAEELCIHTYHSKSKRIALDNFIKGKINRLSCVAALNEGKNIPNLDIGIITQVLSKDLNLIQRMGRIIRKRPDHEAKIYILCCKNTQDEIWLNSALKDLNKDNIKYFNYE